MLTHNLQIHCFAITSSTFLVELFQRAILYRPKTFSLSGWTCPLSWPELFITWGRCFCQKFWFIHSFGLSRCVVLDICVAHRFSSTRPLEKYFRQMLGGTKVRHMTPDFDILRIPVGFWYFQVPTLTLHMRPSILHIIRGFCATQIW